MMHPSETISIQQTLCYPQWCQVLGTVGRAMSITTPHPLADVLEPGYFRRLQDRIEAGDWLFVRAGVGGPSPEFAILAVKEVREGSSGDPGAVVVVPLVSGHRAIEAGEAAA
jgi:hypothetical protein